MIVAPNVPGKLGTFDNGTYEGDGHFLMSTLAARGDEPSLPRGHRGADPSGDRVTVTVIVPFTSTPERDEPFRRVREHLEACPWPVVVATDDHHPYRISHVVNRAIEAADTDIVVINAADSLCPIPQMQEAVKLVSEAPGLVYAFTDYVRHEEDGSRGLVLHKPDGHVCAAIRRHDWLELGGYDESYVGWGLEDREFNVRGSMRWPIRRVPGEVIHLWHGGRRADDSPLDCPAEVVDANWARWAAHA